MHYDINYNSLKDVAKVDKARQDCIDWYGSKERYDEVVTAIAAVLVQPHTTFSVCKFYIEFSGVSGYPAEVITRDAAVTKGINLPDSFFITKKEV